MVMLNACSLNIHVYHICHYKIVDKKFHIKYDLFHHGDEILLNVGASLYSIYSTNHVYLHRPNAFGFWQTHLHLCYETLKRISNFSELAFRIRNAFCMNQNCTFRVCLFSKILIYAL